MNEKVRQLYLLSVGRGTLGVEKEAQSKPAGLQTLQAGVSTTRAGRSADLSLVATGSASRMHPACISVELHLGVPGPGGGGGGRGQRPCPLPHLAAGTSSTLL